MRVEQTGCGGRVRCVASLPLLLPLPAHSGSRNSYTLPPHFLADSLIAPQIQDLLATSAPHVILLTGHASPQTLLAVQQQQRRQETPFQSSAASAYAPSSPSNKTREGAEAELPLLARYQLISTPVLMMTLLSLLVLLPILGLGIMALASIQVPPRMDHVKGIQVGVTLDKKNQ